MMPDHETNHPLEARVAELERRLALLDEAVFEVISELGRPRAPLHGEPPKRLMRIFCAIDRVSDAFLDQEEGAGGSTVAPRLRVVPEVR